MSAKAARKVAKAEAERRERRLGRWQSVGVFVVMLVVLGSSFGVPHDYRAWFGWLLTANVCAVTAWLLHLGSRPAS